MATRSERQGAPVLICPAFVATAMSAIVASSVSPERCEITERVARARAQRDRVERLAERADLVDLDEDRIRDAGVDALGEALRIGHEEVVADELDARAEPLASAAASRPSRPRTSRPRARGSGSGRTAPATSPRAARSTARAPRRGRRRRGRARSSPGRARCRPRRRAPRRRPRRGSARSRPRQRRSRARSRPRRRPPSRARRGAAAP